MPVHLDAGTTCFDPRARMGRDEDQDFTVSSRTLCFDPRARMGRDIPVVAGRAAIFRFDPRARMGRDFNPPFFRGKGTVSIHAPAWGATLQAVFTIARPAWNYPLEAQAMKDAAVVAKRLGVTSKARERDRRPTLKEMERLMDHFVARRKRRPESNPMDRIMGFAMFSTRRTEEITRIEWRGFEVEAKRVMVRDMKNPGDKVGNDVRCELPDEAVKIVEAMPRLDGDDRIFPYSPGAIGAAFTRVCATLGIDEDLHFHDLRHEGISRLFEMGRTIPQVASVSGHRSWTSLKRYTHLRQIGDKWANVGWFHRITLPEA